MDTLSHGQQDPVSSTRQETEIRLDERRVCAVELTKLAGRSHQADANTLLAAAKLLMSGGLTEGSEINRRIADAKAQMEAIDPATHPLDHISAFQHLINLEIERRGDAR